MLTNNITNLEEALNIPGFHKLHQNNLTSLSSGILSIDEILILKNNLPLIMDHNTGYDLRSITMLDIDRLEVHISPHSEFTKNSGGIVVKLYSVEIADKPIDIQTFITNNSSSDFHIGAKLNLSNKRHNGCILLNRSFNAAMYENIEDRGTIVNPMERFDLNLGYKFNILRTVTLSVGSDNAILNTQQRGEIIEGTSRVKDIEQQLIRNNVYSTLATELSKNHSLTVNALLHRYTNEQNTLIKDLSTGKKEAIPNSPGQYSTGYNQGYLSFLLSSKNRAFNYNIGLEINSITDNQFSTINAIQPSYSDYSAIGMFEYTFRKSFVLEGSAKLLTNSLTGSYFMPGGRITLAPNNTLQVIGSYQQSIVYPHFSQSFYPANITDGPRNNILLTPSNLSTTNFKVLVTKENVKLQSGFLVLTQNNDQRILENQTISSTGSRRSSTTYASLVFTNEWVTWKPSILLTGINNTLDTNSLTFFYPEINTYLHIAVPKTKLNIGLTARRIGQRNFTTLEAGEYRLVEQDPYNSLSASGSYTFFDDNLIIAFGANNLSSLNFVETKEYEFVNQNPTLIQQQNAVSNLVRSFFFNIRLRIK